MPYIDGFIIACPEANKDKFIAHAGDIDPLFIEYGAARVLECWQENVPKGETTDFFKAVQAQEDEAVLFSWVEWPDKTARDSAMEKMMQDPRMDPQDNPMPFDGKRLIFGGFETVSERGNSGSPGYVQGYVGSASGGARDAYRDMCDTMAGIAMDHGALRALDCWGDDVPDGEVTDFQRAVKAGQDATIVFGFVEWPSRAAFEEAMPKMREDKRMPAPESDMPIDGKHMIYGGFLPVVTMTK